MECCEKCGKKIVEPLVTAYGEKRCEDCWDDYLWTDTGKVEYFIGICSGDYPMSDFDADFLGHVSVCWKEHRDMLNIPAKEIQEIEAKAEALALL